MESDHKHPARLLAVYPFHRGFGFAVFEADIGLIDWAALRLRPNRDPTYLERVANLFDQYEPSEVVVENAAKTRRGVSARRRSQLTVRLALERRLHVTPISRIQLRDEIKEFADPHVSALILAETMPELEPHIPPKRRPWESVDERAYLMAAVLLGTVAMKQLGWRQ